MDIVGQRRDCNLTRYSFNMEESEKDLLVKDKIIQRLYYWIEKISGKRLSSKKKKEVEEISEQVMEGRKKYKKIKVDKLK